MSEVTVSMTIPDGWELECDTIRAPKTGEFYLAVSGTVLQAADHHMTHRIIVRPAFAWPSWLVCAAIVKTAHGEWWACETVPHVDELYASGWARTGTTLALQGRMILFDPPKCPDWRGSLRVNPKYR